MIPKLTPVRVKAPDDRHGEIGLVQRPTGKTLQVVFVRKDTEQRRVRWYALADLDAIETKLTLSEHGRDTLQRRAQELYESLDDPESKALALQVLLLSLNPHL